MSREIKFRAWDKEEKRMSKVLLIDWLNECVDLDEGVIERDFNQVELLQYTGLEDGARSEIYESDILFDPHYQDHGVVYFDEGCFRVDWDGITEDLFENCEMYVITGNIYENPELLEQSND